MTDHFRHLTGKNEDTEPKPMGDLKVIGAGFAKCGTVRSSFDGSVHQYDTMSLYVALRILGYRSYHMIDVLNNAEAGKLWHEVIQEKQEGRFDNANFDWSRLLGGYDAGVDAPIMDVYDDLAEKFPEAKVILSVREPESWFRSLDQVMLKPAIHNSWYYASAWWEPALWNQINMIRLVIDTWAAKYGNGTLGPQMMQARIDEVKATIHPERLLVYDVKEGWEPLCKFLGKPIPEEPFPRVNDGESLKRVFTAIKRRGMLKWAGTVVAVGGALGFLGLKCLRYVRR